MKSIQESPLRLTVVKIMTLSLLISSFVFWCDRVGIFNADTTNDHTFKKWESFYEFTEKRIPVDIMLFGNSHLYTGINPKNLSLALGSTAFIFGFPGTHIADSYFAMLEAIKIQKPKLIIVETYGINDFNPYDLTESGLSDQFKSFSARRDVVTKLISTPFLFTPDNYLYAWSATLRNHNYVFTNPELLRKNWQLSRQNVRFKARKLYLGRFVRFTSGLQKDVLKRYEVEGAPVNGADYTYSDYAAHYVEKIVSLCEQENIELLFLTLPMYEKHISNYAEWERTLSELIKSYPNKWLNMQHGSGYEGFKEFAFEDTYNNNQHMTYNGSILASYKLADFIRDSLSISLSNRAAETSWHQMFYADEGYFENFKPAPSDPNNTIICSGKEFSNIMIDECLLLNKNNKKANRLLVKIKRNRLQGLDVNLHKLRLILNVEFEGAQQVIALDLNPDVLYHPKDMLLFSIWTKPLNILDVLNAGLILNKID